MRQLKPKLRVGARTRYDGYLALEKREPGKHGCAGRKPPSQDEHDCCHRIELENDPAANRMAVQVQGLLEQAWRQRRIEAEQREGGEGRDGRRGEGGNEGARHANSWPQGKLTQPRDKALHRLWHEQGDDSSGEREHHKCEEGKREGLLRELSEDACEEGPESKTGKRETGGQARSCAAVLAELGHPCGPRTRSERNGEPAHNAAKNKSGIESAK